MFFVYKMKPSHLFTECSIVVTVAYISPQPVYLGRVTLGKGAFSPGKDTSVGLFALDIFQGAMSGCVNLLASVVTIIEVPLP